MSANTSTSYPAAMYPGFPVFGMLHHHHTSAQQLLAANHQAAAAAFMAAQLPMSSFASTLFPHHPATLFGAWTANTPPSSHSPPASPDSTLVDVTATTPAPSPALGNYSFGTIQHDNKMARTILTPCGPISPPTSSGSSPTNSSTNDSTDESSGGGSSKDPSRTFTCKICSRSFGYKHVLQNHERTHTGEKPFECPECHKRFTRDHHLKTHMRLHTGEKPYHCQHCDRQFVQVANLRRHLRVHTGERPFTCEICDGKFSDTNQLKSHMLVHNNNEKPFACDHCPMKFRRRQHLLSHKCGGPLTPAISPITSYVDVQMCDQKSSYGSEDSFDHAKPPPLPTHYAINMLATSSASSEAPLDLSEDCSSSSGGIEIGRSRKPHDIRRVFRLPPQITHIRSEMPMQTEPEDLSMHTPRYCVDSSESMMMQHDDIDIDELDDAAALYMRQQQLGAMRQSMYME